MPSTPVPSTESSPGGPHAMHGVAVGVRAAATNIAARKTTHFVLWSPAADVEAPRLVIGRFEAGNPPALAGERAFDLTPVPGVAGLWEIAAIACDLVDGDVYHYWLEVSDTHPDRRGHRIRCTDPTAFTVDWRLVAPRLGPPYSPDDRQPAAVVKYAGGMLVPCDPGGEELRLDVPDRVDRLAANNRLVLYELPTAWTRRHGSGEVARGVGTFRDVTALVDRDAEGANFDDLDVTRPGYSYLEDLGVNAIELLPPADSLYEREWGYGTSHYFAPDYELGFPLGNSWPTSNTDLAALVRACHDRGMRLFVDGVTAFARNEPSQYVAFDQFCIGDPDRHRDDPDAWTSTRGDGTRSLRDGFGSTLFRYARFVDTYDPVSGGSSSLSPARQHMLACLAHWVLDLRVDGVRLDSVENVANWDFLEAFTRYGRELMNQRWAEAGLPGRADDRFLTVGEELSLPPEILRQNRLDGLWNDAFRQLVRAAILGENAPGLDATFEGTVRKAIDCRQLGFRDGAQAVNYLTSHDVEGFRRERLFHMLARAGSGDVEKRIKLAFVCLLTAVGIPMILAGEEFADDHDLFDRAGNVTQRGGKQVDPMDFNRLTDTSDPLQPMRRRIWQHVARLVKLRTRSDALAVNDTEFIHADFTPGRRVLVWRRGGAGDDPIVVVANFSDWGSDVSDAAAEYRIPNWPAADGRRWREVTQNRIVPPEWAGREPLYPWEAKVYELM